MVRLSRLRVFHPASEAIQKLRGDSERLPTSTPKRKSCDILQYSFRVSWSFASGSVFWSCFVYPRGICFRTSIRSSIFSSNCSTRSCQQACIQKMCKDYTTITTTSVCLFNDLWPTICSDWLKPKYGSIILSFRNLACEGFDRQPQSW